MTRSKFALLVLAAAGLLTAASTIVTARTRVPNMPRWEHLCITANPSPNRGDAMVRDLQSQMNKLGDQGWELVATTSTPGRELFCFKRQNQK